MYVLHFISYLVPVVFFCSANLLHMTNVLLKIRPSLNLGVAQSIKLFKIISIFRVYITDTRGVSLSKLRERMKDRETWHAAVHKVTKSQT